MSPATGSPSMIQDFAGTPRMVAAIAESGCQISGVPVGIRQASSLTSSIVDLAAVLTA
jgi:hypothetical protein